jgi:hypothetical protein
MEAVYVIISNSGVISSSSVGNILLPICVWPQLRAADKPWLCPAHILALSLLIVTRRIDCIKRRPVM